MRKSYAIMLLCLLAAACQQQFVPGSPTAGQPSNIGKTVFYSADDKPLNYLIYAYNDPESAVEMIFENSYNTSCRLICKDYGLFKINVYGKYLGGRVAFGQLNVIAYPQQ